MDVSQGLADAEHGRRAAVLQEAKEEAGVDGAVAKAPIGSYHFMKLFVDGSSKPPQAIIYSVRVTGQRKKWDEKAQRGVADSPLKGCQGGV